MKLNLFVLLVVLHSIVDSPALVSEELHAFIYRMGNELRGIPQQNRAAWFESRLNPELSRHSEPNRQVLRIMIQERAG